MLVLIFIGMMLVMVWLVGELWFVCFINIVLFGFVGVVLLLLSNVVWLVSYYCCCFCVDNVIVVVFYFVGYFLIVCVLYL